MQIFLHPIRLEVPTYKSVCGNLTTRHRNITLSPPSCVRLFVVVRGGLYLVYAREASGIDGLLLRVILESLLVCWLSLCFVTDVGWSTGKACMHTSSDVRGDAVGSDSC